MICEQSFSACPFAPCNFTFCENSISGDVSEFYKNSFQTHNVRHPKVSGVGVTSTSQGRGFDLLLVIVRSRRYRAAVAQRLF